MSGSPLNCWLPRPLNRAQRRRLRRASAAPTPKQLRVERLEARDVPVVFAPSCLSGHVFEDCNNNGNFDKGEEGIAGVTVVLTGTEIFGKHVSATVTTGSDGSYKFNNLQPGTYQLAEPGQPTKVINGRTVNYLDGKTHVGTIDGMPTGTASTDLISNIQITSGGSGSHSDGCSCDCSTPPDCGVDFDFGEVYSELSGCVFLDLNANGKLEPNLGETGLPGVTVTLTGADDNGANVSLIATTDAQGNFDFVSLRPGTYQLSETQPAGLTSTINTAGDVGGTVSGDVISHIVLDGCTTAGNYCFGENRPAPGSISGHVFLDCNNNGEFEPSNPAMMEEPIAGALVTISGILANGQDAGVAAATTDANGFYEFANLAPGTYTVSEPGQPTFTLADGTVVNVLEGKTHVGSLNGSGTTDLVTGIPITASAAGTDYDFGEVYSQLTGVVYNDLNRSGVQDTGEPGLPGVTVTLQGTNDVGAVSIQTTTDAQGRFSFLGLRPGSYQVVETQPAGFVSTANIAGNAGGTVNGDTIINVPLNGCTVANGYFFGENKQSSGSVSGHVFEDCDNNGVFEPAAPASEEPISGATVVLAGTETTGVVVSATTTTDANGFYIFNNLNPGTYHLTEPGTPTKTLADGTVVNYLDGKTHVGSLSGAGTVDDVSNITLTAAAAGTDYDFGELYSQLAGTVFFDKNANGVFETNLGETPLPGVTVTLLGTNDQGQSVSVVATTNAQGQYLFANLRPGNYAVVETQPAGFVSTINTAGNAGGTVVGDTIINVSLNGCTNANGYVFGENQNPTNSISGLVFNACLDDLPNAPGADEVPLAGVAITLTGTDSQGAAVSLTTTTAANGTFSFNNLKPGTYNLHETQPTTSFDGPDAAGTLGGTVGGLRTDDITNIVIPADNQAHAGTGYNFSEFAANPLSGVAYFDANRNHKFDAGESPEVGVVVNLTGTDYLGAAVNLTTTTAADGTYSFSLPNFAGSQTGGLRPGRYQVSSPTALGVTDVYFAGTGTCSSDIPLPGLPVLHSISGFVYLDNNDNGIFEGQGVTTLTVSASGSQVGDGTGVTPQGAAPLQQVAAVTTQHTAVHGGTVVQQIDASGHIIMLLDANTEPAPPGFEPAISGVVVELFNANTGQLLGTRTTDSHGFYEFANLQAGLYRLVQIPPPRFLDTKDTPGVPFPTSNNSEDVFNNIVVPAPGTPPTVSQNGVSYNFGHRLPDSITGTVFEDCGVPGKANNGVQDAGEAGIPGVTLQLFNDITNTLLQTTTTDANGHYAFTNLLDNITYRIVETQPPGFLDGKDSVGTPFGGNDNTNDVLAGIFIPVAAGGRVGVNYNFAEIMPSSLAGFVFTYSGTPHNRQPDSPQVAGTTITLTGTNDLGQSVTATTLTGQVPGRGVGYYEFTNLRPGTYAIVETQPAKLTDGPDYIGTQGGVVGSDRLDINLDSCTAGIENNFSETTGGISPGVLASLSGHVYWDINCSGMRDTGDQPIPGTTITLTGHFNAPNAQGDTATVATTTTDTTGFYIFRDLPPGTYTLTETQPTGFIQARDTFGTPFPAQLLVQDVFSNVTIPDTVVNGTLGLNYDYGERTLSKQDFLGNPPPATCAPIVGVQSNGNGVAVPLGTTGGGVQGEVITQQFFNPLNVPVTVTGSSTSSIVRAQDATTGQPLAAFYAFDPTFAGGVNVAVAHLNHDANPDVIVGAGPGGGPAVKVFGGIDGSMVATFFAFDPAFRGGVNVTAADVNGDGIPDLIAAAGPGGGPAVKVIDGTKLNQVQANGEIADSALIASFFAFDSTDPNFTKGVNVAAGDVNGDGRADLILGAMAGGTPEVRVLNVAGGMQVMQSFNAYAAGFSGGVSVAAADVDGDGRADIITGAGAGGGPEVRVVRGTDLAALADFFAYESTFTGGVRVGAADLTGDGRAEVFTAPGSGSPRVRLFQGVGGSFSREYPGADVTSLGGLTIGGGAPPIAVA
ncbi:MAG: SdrD B-like domain-containing protein [Gemmataceae bacterium]